MYLPRSLKTVFLNATRQFPATLITGPRQSGKTTFLKNETEKEVVIYENFDDPLTRSIAIEDPVGFLDQFSERPVILDEIQYVPDLLPYLKIRIDGKRQQTGKWLLTGSQQFQLMKNVSESLAGRIAILELLPFSFPEKQQKRPSLEEEIWQGSYPEPYIFPERRDLWIKSYIQTYIERDVRQIHNIGDLHLFEQFVSLCAARHGQEYNQSAIGKQIGITQPTAKAWGNILVSSYIAYFLGPYFENFGKRIIKTPKLYFLDSALVCALTRQVNGISALAGPMGGSLLEGWVVAEAVKFFFNKGQRADLYFWRSNDGLEVDLIMRVKGILIPVEIKLTATPTLHHIKPMEKFKKLAGLPDSSPALLICRIEKQRSLTNGTTAIPWHEFPAWLKERAQDA